MRFGILMIFLFASILSFSQRNQDYEKLDLEKVKADLDTIRIEMDSTLYYINATYKLLREEIELFGWKKTIQINSGRLFPFIVFWGLYFLWLKNRN